MTFDGMRTMLKELANVTNDYYQDGIVLFELDEQDTELIRMDFQYFNDSFNSLVFTTANDTLNYFEGFDTNFTRDFLLNIQWLKFTTKLGSNNFVNNY